MTISQFICQLAVHIAFSYGAIFYVKTHIYEEENQQILDNLSEGIVIIDKKCGKVRLVNSAADLFEGQEGKELSASDCSKREIKFDKKSKTFAKIDCNLLNDDQVKVETILDSIHGNENYQSLEEVIEQLRSCQNQKFIYKRLNKSQQLNNSQSYLAHDNS